MRIRPADLVSIQRSDQPWDITRCYHVFSENSGGTAEPYCLSSLIERNAVGNSCGTAERPCGTSREHFGRLLAGTQPSTGFLSIAGFQEGQQPSSPPERQRHREEAGAGSGNGFGKQTRVPGPAAPRQAIAGIQIPSSARPPCPLRQ